MHVHVKELAGLLAAEREQTLTDRAHLQQLQQEHDALKKDASDKVEQCMLEIEVLKGRLVSETHQTSLELGCNI